MRNLLASNHFGSKTETQTVSKPGASEFLTPREVIRDFLNILSLLRQNPQLDKGALFRAIEIRDERPDERAPVADSIEVL